MWIESEMGYDLNDEGEEKLTVAVVANVHHIFVSLLQNRRSEKLGHAERNEGDE